MQGLAGLGGLILRRVQVDAKPDQRIALKAHLRRVLPFNGDENQGFTPDPLAIEVDIGAVSARQYNVAAAEL